MRVQRIRASITIERVPFSTQLSYVMRSAASRLKDTAIKSSDTRRKPYVCWGNAVSRIDHEFLTPADCNDSDDA